MSIQPQRRGRPVVTPNSAPRVRTCTASSYIHTQPQVRTQRRSPERPMVRATKPRDPLGSDKRFDAFLESGWVRKVSCCTVIDILFHRLNNCPNVKHCTLWVKNKTLSQTQFMTTQFTRVTARETDRQTIKQLQYVS